MPRPFADQERELLRRKLVLLARRRIEESGIRAMSIEDLTRQVGISKGAFYLLYDSKDALVMQVLGEAETEVRDRLLAVAADRSADPTTLSTRVVREIFEVMGGHPVLALLADPEEGAHIWRMVPPEDMEARMTDDDAWFATLTAGLRSEGVFGPDVSDDTLAAIARLSLAVARDPDLNRHPDLPELLVQALGAHLSGGRK
ncbi:MAG TPA: TetR/AcrR family transcriptional regulator [Acidimicrobiia bacterium]|nr:TetR/AcrR family transcriptional regulator [Acidimicrobiia bacterium]